MNKAGTGDQLQSALDAMQAALDRQARVLSALEDRLGALHDDVRESAEVLTRLKLASENAKQVAVSHREALSVSDKRLEQIEARLSRLS